MGVKFPGKKRYVTLEWRLIHVLCYPRGSAGIVRRVIDKNSGNQYACKFLRFNNPMLKEELQLELEVMASLSHPNIVQVEDGYEDKKRLAIVMEMYPIISRMS